MSSDITVKPHSLFGVAFRLADAKRASCSYQSHLAKACVGHCWADAVDFSVVFSCLGRMDVLTDNPDVARRKSDIPTRFLLEG